MEPLIFFAATILVNAFALWLAARLLPGVTLRGFGTAIVVALLLALLNATVRPILVVLTFPLTVLTLGLFLVVIAGFVLKVADWLVPGFHIRSFLWAMALALLLGLINLLLFALIPGL